MKDLYIFGAQGLAKLARLAIEELNPDRKIKAFIVTRPGDNPKEIAGKPVLELKAFAEGISDQEKENIEVLIAAPSAIQPEIEEALEENRLYNHRRLDPDRWAELAKLYFTKIGRFTPVKALPVGSEEAFVRVFVVKSHKDIPLKQEYPLEDYMVPIQAGAVLADRAVARLKDNGSADNISAENGDYGELSALYYIWKNRLSNKEGTSKRYVGLYHYRRRLSLSEEDVCRIASNDVDVVLPYPYPYYPSIKSHHEICVDAKVWAGAMQAIEELFPEYAKAIPGIMKEQYMHVCNIILAREEVLYDYCSWLFPILKRTIELAYPEGGTRTNRGIGILGETLESVYFFYNADKLKIALTDFREMA